jgi:hypothetical protein
MRHQASRATFRNEARQWIDAVQAADGQALEPAVITAMVDLIEGIKTDYSGFADFESMLIMAGPRTLAGALVPFRGPAPTNDGFVSGDYDRRAGFSGGGNGKSIATNYSFSADRRTSHHVVFNTHSGSAGSWLIYFTNASNFSLSQTTGTVSVQQNGSVVSDIRVSSARNTLTAPQSTLVTQTGYNTPPGFRGIQRLIDTEFTVLGTSATSTPHIKTSCTAGEWLLSPFHLLPNEPVNTGTGNMNFWCAGAGIDLAALRTRLQTYETTLAGITFS